METLNVTVEASEPWETKLVGYRILFGIGMLIIGGALVNIFIL